MRFYVETVIAFVMMVALIELSGRAVEVWLTPAVGPDSAIDDVVAWMVRIVAIACWLGFLHLRRRNRERTLQ